MALTPDTFTAFVFSKGGLNGSSLDPRQESCYSATTILDKVPPRPTESELRDMGPAYLLLTAPWVILTYNQG